jgi:hypothetical protein
MLDPVPAGRDLEVEERESGPACVKKRRSPSRVLVVNGAAAARAHIRGWRPGGELCRRPSGVGDSDIERGGVSRGGKGDEGIMVSFGGYPV